LNSRIHPQVPAPLDQLVIGEILRPHGIRGELRMRVLTATRDYLPELGYVYLSDAEKYDAEEASRKQRHEVKTLRFNKRFALLALDGIETRNEAELLRGKLVSIDAAQAPAPQAGDYHPPQVLGMRVFTADNELGVVREVLETGANDVYVLASEGYGELLLPAHEETIVAIDFERQRITMELPDGLLPS